MMSELDAEIVKAAMKEGLKEWLDEKFSTLGKWSAGTFAALALVAVVWLILRSQGWQAPH
jgi:predicted ferric reductase